LPTVLPVVTFLHQWSLSIDPDGLGGDLSTPLTEMRRSSLRNLELRELQQCDQEDVQYEDCAVLNYSREMRT
jgi:hypothetical protein